MTTDNDTLPVWSPRGRAGHKGDFGHVLVIGGSPGFTGAPALAANAAQRGGAGLVTAVVPRACWPVVASHCVEPMVHPENDNRDGHFAATAGALLGPYVANAHAVVLGPGLGRHPDTAGWVRTALRDWDLPIVVDADGLNAVVGDLAAITERSAPTVLTPHPGEMARLIGGDTAAVQSDRVGVASQLASDLGAIVVLKGQGTVCTDGGGHWINDTGNPGMATGGSGDVLAGLIGALIGQAFSPIDAARLGVFLHGQAGDLAVHAVGEVSLVAGDLLTYLPVVIQDYQESGADAADSEAHTAE